VDRLIVDGYNMIYAWPELIPLKDVKLEDARDLLVAMLADYAAMTQQRITVVFDSHRRPDAGEGSVEHRSGIEVVFSGRKTSADHLIERLIYQTRGGEVTVATSDGVQRDMALGMGVKTVSAMSLHALLVDVRDRTSTEMHDRKARSDLGRRLEDRLDERTRERLERWRRGTPDEEKT
jgi:predicted RNA-binding protein with PIN domain